MNLLIKFIASGIEARKNLILVMLILCNGVFLFYTALSTDVSADGRPPYIGDFIDAIIQLLIGLSLIIISAVWAIRLFMENLLLHFRCYLYRTTEK